MTRGPAVHKKKLKTPLRIEMEGMETKYIIGPWNLAIEKAKRRAGWLAEDNIGKSVHVYEQGNPVPVWTSRMIYSWHDSVWGTALLRPMKKEHPQKLRTEKQTVLVAEWSYVIHDGYINAEKIQAIK
ncbi:hypothetical protein UFOVP353_17 [uncultured Caudovirales phage]|uniref:Uncharacterized protein n=1 Tax=uncultured Caudovirales phage TaxID=2100421 RepID=A0A6J5M0H6_9CAUD|nr:hypothetical protein UFOVP353_17 [uncultured Caudovirales phage]